MSVTVYLSGHLKEFTRGETEVNLPGEYKSVGELLDALWKHHLKLRDRVLNEQGEIRQHVNIFLGSSDIKRLDGLQTPITEPELHIFNAVSGG
jgi:molybdopterin converting factor small subunit